MADEIIKREQNYRTVAAGIGDDSDQEILMFRVDPITNYLLISATLIGPTAQEEFQIARRDENHRTVCLAWNEQDEELQEVLTDGNGYLLCDLA